MAKDRTNWAVVVLLVALFYGGIQFSHWMHQRSQIKSRQERTIYSIQALESKGGQVLLR